jgi:hypothetical protein
LGVLEYTSGLEVRGFLIAYQFSLSYQQGFEFHLHRKLELPAFEYSSI